MNIPCPINTPCIDDANALGNFSSEDPDRALFKRFRYKNQIWDGAYDPFYACAGFCVSEVSQAEADLCAENNAQICQANRQYRSREHTCSKTCPNGNVYTFTVPAGAMVAYSQAQADAMAVQWCQEYLNQLCDSLIDPADPDRKRPPGPRPKPNQPGIVSNDEQYIEAVCIDGGRAITIPAGRYWAYNKADANIRAREAGNDLIGQVGCLTSLPESICLGNSISQFVVPDQVRLLVPPYEWQVFGIVPAGLNFAPNLTAMRVFGTPTAAGDYIFKLTLFDKFRLHESWRTYRLSVMEITSPTALPVADEDQPYSYTITTTAGRDPKTYSLKLGSTLPVNLLLDAFTGTISGTPATFGDFSFTILVADAKGAVCEKDFTLHINPNIFASIPWSFISSSTGPGCIASASGAGYSAQAGVAVFPASGDGGVARALFYPPGYPGVSEWTCNNTTGAPISASITVVVTGSNLVPPNPGGIQISAFSGVFHRITYPGPVIVDNVMNILGFVPGVYTAPFTIPVGITIWRGLFMVGAGPSGPPYPGGTAGVSVTFDIP